MNHLVSLGRYHDKRDAEDAVDALNGRQYDGRELRISIDAGRPGGSRSVSFNNVSIRNS